MIHSTRIARLLPLVALGCVAVAFLLVKDGPLVTQTSNEFSIETTRNVIVSARDGVRLAADVYLPRREGMVNGRFSTIVERTPYNKDTAADAVVHYFVPRGYAVVYQDVRGALSIGRAMAGDSG